MTKNKDYHPCTDCEHDDCVECMEINETRTKQMSENKENDKSLDLDEKAE